ncbi:MAG: class I SAM-dependent methyltransferase [Deltaproteobacteria bacterium]|nr:class I SAM-dependent methyltransferase [Deltaproteobacteria bacterium]
MASADRERAMKAEEQAAADRIFLETTRRLAPPILAHTDVALALDAISTLRPVVDLGCGFGRHLAALQAQGVRAVGLDRSLLLLREVARLAPEAARVRGDLTRLPLRTGSVGAALCFYSSMFLGSLEDAQHALHEAARILRPGGRLVLTTDNPLRLARQPHHEFETELTGLGRVRESSTFDAHTQIDTIDRTLTMSDGAVYSATFRIRYFLPDTLRELTAAAGLRWRQLVPDAPLTVDTPQLACVLERQAW